MGVVLSVAVIGVVGVSVAVVVVGKNRNRRSWSIERTSNERTGGVGRARHERGRWAG